MARTYTAKGVHTNPKDAGKQNLEPVLDKLPKDEDNTLTKLLPIYRHKDPYQGRWTAEELARSIDELFAYCESVDIKPTQPALRLWLKVSHTQLADWRFNKDGKYGDKSAIIKEAFDIMEMTLQARIEKYPTGNIFLLKTSYGHVETSKVDVTTTGSNAPNVDEVNDLVAKMGLDK